MSGRVEATGSRPVEATGRHVILIGMMGSGKSSLGRVLSARLGRPLFDSDAMIEARTGQTVAEIFASRGEPAFRAEEKAVLADALASPVPAVVAAAGGTVLDAANRRLMASRGLVVWLRAEPDVLAQRVRPGDHRPLLAGDAPGALKRLVAERERYYAELADVAVDVAAASVDEAADAVEAALADVGGTARARRGSGAR